ncbi:hypothetical protein GF345_03615 [Candidatus Woesearchaeota archaeon]|nr:hypothetical protein [Candidatus Woesearchaeota archaeon]
MINSQAENTRIEHISRLFDIVSEGYEGPEADKLKLEAVKWLKKYSEVGPNRFGVVKISGASIEKHLDEFTDQISVLSGLGLNIPIIYGWGDTLSKRLKELNEMDGVDIKSSFHPETNDRITDMLTMYLVRGMSSEYGGIIETALQNKGIRARLCKGIFHAVQKNLPGIDDSHYTGRVWYADTREIDQLVRDSIMPVVSPIGVHADTGEKYNCNADNSTSVLAYTRKAEKIVMVTNTGGILDEKGEIVSQIMLDQDHNPIDAPELYGGMAKKLETAIDTYIKLAECGYTPSIQITAPGNLVAELFTDAGKGTCIKKAE